MKSLDRQQAQKMMNHLGRSGESFLFILSFDSETNYVLPAASLSEDEVHFQVPGKSFGGAIEPVPLKDLHFTASPISFEHYQKAFNKVREALLEGNSYLLNLTFPTPISTNLSLDQMYDAAVAPYKLLLRDHFVCYSPEPFVRIEGRQISAFPMKGTIDASLPDAAQRLLIDPKEIAEHRTIVDLIRNDLGMVASEVTVPRFAYLQEVETHRGRILQMSSEISGQLGTGYREALGTLLFTLLPAGSVTGAPKKKTVEIILEAEAYQRGFYTGVFGWYDGTTLESSVMIRFVEQDASGALTYKSGGGITVNSEVEKEYQELIDKVYVPVSGVR